MYKLIIEDDEGKTTVVPLIRDEITIGRKEGNTIRLTERNVSRRHAKLSRSNGSVYIEDLQSSNGIKVNGDKIAGRTTVAEGDRIQIGDYQLALKADRQAAAIPMPEPRQDEKTTPFIRDEPAPSNNRTASIDLPPTVQAHVIATAPEAERPARLVVVSSNFARQEFGLDKPLMVIGRTDDNDIVINHRSISRHHAQIQREGSHYHVIDLQSANGVRVNGEEYGKVELRKGDMIDLGHVRLRFIAPGEDFVFDRDAKVVDVAAAQAAKGRPGMFIAVGGALLLLVVGVVGYMMFGRGKSEPGKTGGGDDSQVAKLAFEADKAIGAQDWDTAIQKATDALAIDPKAETLRVKKAKAENEKKSQATFEKYERAVKGDDTDTAVTLFQQIPDESVYHEKAQSTFPPVKKLYIKEHLGKAKGLSKCDEVRRETDSVLLLDPSNVEAMEIQKKCSGTPAATPTRPTKQSPSETPTQPKQARTPTQREPSQPSAPAVREPPPVKATPVEPPKAVEPPKKEPPAEASSAGLKDAEKMVGEAQESYIHANYADAIEKARKALKASPNEITQMKAWKIIGGSYCFLKEKPGAASAWNHLDTPGRQLLNYTCRRNGIELP